jgi:hypothetical protein
MYSVKRLLMMGAKSTQNMYSAFQGIIKTRATSCITLLVLLIEFYEKFMKNCVPMC